jgi:membrane protein
MTLHFKNFLAISKTAFKKWLAKDPFRESAVIAYYSIFSLPGLLVVILTSAGYFLGRDAVNNHLTAQITATLGAQTADQIHSIIVKASEAKNSIWAAIIGVITIIVGATGVFAEFQKSLNTIWEVTTDKSKSGLWHIIRVRLFSFGLIVSFAFILIVSLVVSAMISALGHWLSGHFTTSFPITLQVVNSIASLIILAGLFALMFMFFPDAKIKWHHVWVGSLVTAFLFDIGKFALGFYFGKANPGAGYGAAGSIILIMIWTSYSSMIVFYGAEFTHAYAQLYSGTVPPTEIARAAVPAEI